MRAATPEEVETVYGFTPEELDALEEDATSGVFVGSPAGEVVVGRPLLFNEQMRQISFKEPVSKVAAIDKRASELGMKRSDYLRSLVDEDLERAQAC